MFKSGGVLKIFDNTSTGVVIVFSILTRASQSKRLQLFAEVLYTGYKYGQFFVDL